ncbi:hypothetical protein HDV01_001724 [Terramyces sp. JEL0728]|nr:hypothetical protein HDV01_001724 [Terramyces sp. JEL0728]
MKVNDKSAEKQTRSNQRAQRKSRVIADMSEQSDSGESQDICSSPEKLPSRKRKSESEPVKRGPGRPRKIKKGDPKAKKSKKEPVIEDSNEEENELIEQDLAKDALSEEKPAASRSPLSYSSELTRNNLDFLVTASEQVEKVSIEQSKSNTTESKMTNPNDIVETEEEMDIVQRLKKIQDEVIAKCPIQLVDFSKSKEKQAEARNSPRFIDCTADAQNRIKNPDAPKREYTRRYFREVLDANDPARGNGQPYKAPSPTNKNTMVLETGNLENVLFSQDPKKYSTLSESDKLAYHNAIVRERAKYGGEISALPGKTIMVDSSTKRHPEKDEIELQYNRYLSNIKRFDKDVGNPNVSSTYLTLNEFKAIRQREKYLPKDTRELSTMEKMILDPAHTKASQASKYEETLKYSLEHVEIVSPENFTQQKRKYSIKNESAKVVADCKNAERKQNEIDQQRKELAKLKAVAKEVGKVDGAKSPAIGETARRRKGSFPADERRANTVQQQQPIQMQQYTQQYIQGRNVPPTIHQPTHQYPSAHPQQYVQLSNIPPQQNPVIEYIDLTSDEDAGNRKVPHSFVEWKLEIMRFYSDPISLLTLAHKLDLKELEEGSYTFGTDRKCRERVIRSSLGSPRCPNLLGTIHSQGEAAPKTLALTYGKQSGTYSLRPGLLIDVDRNIRIEVDDLNRLNLYDLTREFYTNLQKAHGDMFYPYNFNFVYAGEMIAPNQLLVNFLGQDVVFSVHNFGSSLQVYYTDIVSSEQRVFPVRSIVLKPHGKKYILNFNFSFPCPLFRRGGVNGIKHAMRAGLNPLYF